MRAELLEGLRTVMRGEHTTKTYVTPVTPVTDMAGNRWKPAELQALHRLQVKASKVGTASFPPVTALVEAAGEADEAEIEERAGLAADRAPAVYLDAWARLNCQKPFDVSEAEWRLALNDGGLFLDDVG